MPSDEAQIASVQHSDGLARVIAGYQFIDALSRRVPRVPYLYGGGHNVAFDLNGGGDCSGLVSAVLHHDGTLGIPHVAFPFDTNAFEHWGLAGEGKYRTLWVRDWSGPLPQHHCALEFHIFNMHLYPQRWAQAAHAGTNIGWGGTEPGDWGTEFSTTGFLPRHWPGT